MPSSKNLENDPDAGVSFFDKAEVAAILRRGKLARNEPRKQEDITDRKCLGNLDDEVPKQKSDDKPKEMICYRCPTKKIGTFINIQKFEFHIQRHATQDLFRCVTCERPFTSLANCVAHETAVHGTMIPSHLLNDQMD
ncbi:unnamed protein product [Orchesella dallaii]|uniref:C2H2-type domain-containing protein n=1 Tax=Orchesella dallaii TaxID=48710 RepID=A0ABP1RRX3_9HEXA